MIYLLNKCELPWSNFHLLFKGKSDCFKDYLRERNDVKYLRQLFKMIPKPLITLCKIVLMLKFEEEPPYQLFEDTLKLEISKLE